MRYKIVHSFFYALSVLPYRILYVISDFVYLLVYRMVGYRKDIVRKNISSAFPEKSEKELRSIERGFYHWLCDYFMEAVKLLSISDEELLKHIEFRNAEQLEECFDRGQTCAAMLGHYCNWEMLSATQLAMQRHKDAVFGLIYHPLRSDIADRLFLDIRSQKKGVCIPKKEILKYLVKYKREKRMWLFGYISDQGPKYMSSHLWLKFLNHDTGVFTGGERIMRKMNDAVFYVDAERPCRGKYIFTFKLITDKPEEMPENEITRKFFGMLEQTIRREPRFYLWSHNRWKRTKEYFDEHYRIEHGRVVMIKDEGEEKEEQH